MFRRTYYTQKNLDAQLASMVANQTDEFEILELVANGANPDGKVRTQAGGTTTAFDEAFIKGNLDLMKAMAKTHTIDVNHLDDNHFTKLLAATAHREHFVMAFLLQLGASVSIQTKNGNTALHGAILNNDPIAAKLLLEHIKLQKQSQNRVSKLFSGKNPLNIKNNEGFTPWSLAINLGYHDLATLIEQYQPAPQEAVKSDKFQPFRRKVDYV